MLKKLLRTFLIVTALLPALTIPARADLVYDPFEYTFRHNSGTIWFALAMIAVLAASIVLMVRTAKKPDKKGKVLILVLLGLLALISALCLGLTIIWLFF